MKASYLLFGLFVCVAAHAGSASNQTTLPPTQEPAGVDNPECGAGTTNPASVVLEGFAAGVDAYVGLPITTDALANRSVENRILVMLGLHNGKSACQTLCVGVPATAELKVSACMKDEWSDGWKCNDEEGHNAVGWAYVEKFSKATQGDSGLYCVSGKHWSHDRSRDFKLDVSW